jgi:aldose 1-epimerase
MKDTRKRWTGKVEEVRITSPGGAMADIMTYGAIIRDLQVRLRNGQMQRVVLGLDSFDPYPDHSPFFGAIAGRVANRIGGASFVLDGKRHHLAANNGRHCLHGGPEGMNRVNWRLLDHAADSVTLGYNSRDGENGFPGNLSATCVYRLEGEADLYCELSATTDAPTPVNLAQHNYYNLDGSSDTGAHLMEVFADFFTPNDMECIPTGEIRSLDGSPYDFRIAKPLKQIIDGARFEYDSNFVLRSGGGALAHAATVTSPVNGLALEVHTDQPGMQFYDGHKLALTIPGLGGAIYGASAGFCLEPQKFPDAVNKPHFPNTILRPGDAYRQTSLFRFKAR